MNVVPRPWVLSVRGGIGQGRAGVCLGWLAGHCGEEWGQTGSREGCQKGEVVGGVPRCEGTPLGAGRSQLEMHFPPPHTHFSPHLPSAAVGTFHRGQWVRTTHSRPLLAPSSDTPW